jgi:hypothetical protein
MSLDQRIPNVHPAHGGRATTVLVLGLLSLLCVPTGPFAWFIGRRELRAIKRGDAPIDGEGKARLGMILGILQTLLLAAVLAFLLLVVPSLNQTVP